MARIFVYDDREFPDPDAGMTVDEVKATVERLLRGDRQRLGEGDQARQTTPCTSSSGGWAPRGPSPGKEASDGHPAPSPVCWRRLADGGPEASSSSRRSSHGPTAPSTWTPRPHGRRMSKLPAPRRRTTPRPRGGSRRRCGGSCGPGAPERPRPNCSCGVRRRCGSWSPSIGYADDYAWFTGLVRRLFPNEAEEALSLPDVRTRVERFANLFGEKHFPLYGPRYIEFWAEWDRRGAALVLAAGGAFPST